MTEPAKSVLTELCGPHCGATNHDGSRHMTVGHCEPCHDKVPLAVNGRHVASGGNGHLPKHHFGHGPSPWPPYRGPIPKVG